jgi:putative ATP-binding cassette transporter
MKMIYFLLRYSREIKYSRIILLVAMLTGMASGFINAALLALINYTLNHRGPVMPRLVLGFAVLCLVLPITKLVSETLLLRLTQGIMLDLRLHLSRRILAAPLRLLEELKAPRLLASLTEDIPNVTNAIITLPLLCMHATVVIGCLIYLGWLSWTVLLGVLGFMIVGILSYQLPTIKALRYFKKAREEWDSLVKHFRTMIEGTKELKLHHNRREAFLDQDVLPTATSLRRYQFIGNIMFLVTRSWGQVLFFILVGLLLFALPTWQPVDAQTLTGYILALLYMMAPLEVILNAAPALGRAKISIEKIEKIGLSLSGPAEIAVLKPELTRSWQQLELVGITHSYYREGENSHFTLGPISASFRPGELVFLAGGNGSGKTTLAKLLTGLYVPESGEIRLDGQTVNDETREQYRQLFSAVFSDFYLFEKLLGLDSSELDAQARSYLAQLQLEHKVKVTAGVLSTTDLSHGQRKRLALLTAYLEDRPFYVFDEWAADQDPLFKNIFYLSLLPELKAKGKAVLVITHDDRYYHLADSLIKLDYGQIQHQKPIGNEEAIPALALA